jgi:hypothetical protein
MKQKYWESLRKDEFRCKDMCFSIEGSGRCAGINSPDWMLGLHVCMNGMVGGRRRSALKIEVVVVGSLIVRNVAVKEGSLLAWCSAVMW